MSDRFRLTLGLRADRSVYFNSSYRGANLNPDGSFAGTYTEGDPTIPNNDNLTLFDGNGNPVSNGVGKALDNTSLPNGTLFSPRLGFNFDVNGDKTLQIRGGSGLFTGRFPFVWIGNHIGNPFSFFTTLRIKTFGGHRFGEAI